MKSVLKLAFILVGLTASLACAGMANIVVDPTANTLTGTVTAGGSTLGDWVVSGSGKASGASVSSGAFTIGNGSFTVDATPDLTTAGNTHFSQNGTTTVTVTFTGNPTLNVTVDGVTKTATSGQALNFFISNFATATVDLQFSGSGNGNNFAITNVNVTAPVTPEPKSVLVAALLVGSVCCVERRRIGGLLGGYWERFSRG